MEENRPDPSLSLTEDPYEFPSDETLRELPKGDKIEALREWFFWNFEDPAEMTPHESREGGYIYIWGGPFDARDELNNRFDGAVSENREYS